MPQKAYSQCRAYRGWGRGEEKRRRGEKGKKSKCESGKKRQRKPRGEWIKWTSDAYSRPRANAWAPWGHSWEHKISNSWAGSPPSSPCVTSCSWRSDSAWRTRSATSVALQQGQQGGGGWRVNRKGAAHLREFPSKRVCHFSPTPALWLTSSA